MRDIYCTSVRSPEYMVAGIIPHQSLIPSGYARPNLCLSLGYDLSNMVSPREFTALEDLLRSTIPVRADASNAPATQSAAADEFTFGVAAHADIVSAAPTLAELYTYGILTRMMQTSVVACGMEHLLGQVWPLTRFGDDEPYTEGLAFRNEPDGSGRTDTHKDIRAAAILPVVLPKGTSSTLNFVLPHNIGNGYGMARIQYMRRSIECSPWGVTHMHYGSPVNFALNFYGEKPPLKGIVNMMFGHDLLEPNELKAVRAYNDARLTNSTTEGRE